MCQSRLAVLPAGGSGSGQRITQRLLDNTNKPRDQIGIQNVKAEKVRTGTEF